MSSLVVHPKRVDDSWVVRPWGQTQKGLLGGSWVVISGVIRLLIWVITTHEPPSRA